MFVQQDDDGRRRLVTSASDLTVASRCEFAFLRRVDAKLGRDIQVPPDDDAMLARAARLGDAHEERTLERYRGEFGAGAPGQAGGVVEIPRPASMRAPDLRAVAEESVRALRGGAEVVFQATFFEAEQLPAERPDDFDLGFVGFADFLRRTEDGTYEVQDTKLARRAKVTALLQLAAYAEQLERIDVPVAADATLILGDGSHSRHRLADIAPVFRARRQRLHEVLLDRARATGRDGETRSAAAIAWSAPGISACGRCEVCTPEVERARDPLLIAGLRATQRNRLIAAGLDTIDDVAAALPEFVDGTRAVEGIAPAVLERIALQAEVQVGAVAGAPPPVRVGDPAELAALPRPDPGDLFFDFEGDPLYSESGAGGGTRWGLDYLFGMVDTHEEFMPIWAHDLDAERHALEQFLSFVAERRRLHPNMHIYHYAAYERTHLLSIAARHGVGEAEVDRLLREHVLVDLYPIVRRALRVGSRSYSIKKLEPLYMGDRLRDAAGVTDGAESVAEYAEARSQLSSDDPDVREQGRHRLEAIADYNRYDCVSTLELRDWLLRLAAEHGVRPHATGEVHELETVDDDVSEIGKELLRLAALREDPAETAALRLAASAIDYHRREQKSFWWAHFARLVDPVDDWADTRDVMVVDAGLSEVENEWSMPPRGRVLRRTLRLRGTVAPGSSMKPGGEAYALYRSPPPFPQPGGAPGARGACRVRIIERHLDGVTVEERLPPDAPEYDVLPVALTPGPPPPAGRQKEAIEEWGRALCETLGSTPSGAERDPVYDLLRRTPPRTVGGRGLVAPDSAEALAAVDGDPEARVIGAVVSSLRMLDRSYLAVQGPPGTGKTYLAARVIRKLVEEDGWRVGVVAQSHKVVENVLDGVVDAGLAPEQVGKVPQGGRAPSQRVSGGEALGDTPDAPSPRPSYTILRNNGHAAFIEHHRDAGRGAVIGGTAWDFSNEIRFSRRGLDLLVIDEAGQFSLAPTVAASVSAERLLLLGDPQQLPQVSQGSHPEPVDTSALGWLIDEAETLPQDLGYFLGETRRMRPELAEVVSELAYEGRLHAHPNAAERVVEGAGRPGLTWHPVRHSSNATASPEEAAEVVGIARQALRGSLRATGSGALERSLAQNDVIVVAAYNAQVECIAEALAEAGLAEVRVGTVDRFQGQEAVIAIVSLAASSVEDVPRGLEFLLMRNRLNVAISRAQWAAHLVSSDRLGDGLPGSAEGVAALSGYLRLIERGSGL